MLKVGSYVRMRTPGRKSSHVYGRIERLVEADDGLIGTIWSVLWESDDYPAHWTHQYELRLIPTDEKEYFKHCLRYGRDD